MKAKLPYHVRWFHRNSWQVIGPSGHPIYDGAPHGKDKPVIFHDEDAAIDCADRCNLDDTEEA